MRYPVLPEWRATVLEVMERRGMTQGELARLCDTSGASISRLLNGEAAVSELVPQVNAALGIQQEDSDAMRRWMLLYDQMTEDERGVVITLIENLRKLRK